MIELFGRNILAVITVVVMLGFSVAILFGVAKPIIIGGTCYGFSSLRHFYHSLCVRVGKAELVCVSDILPGSSATSSFETPLIGCSSNVVDVSTNSKEEVLSAIAEQVFQCYQQYGAGDKNVLWAKTENPATCAVISANIKEELTAKDITDTFKAFGTKITSYDCENCEANPCPEGFSCDIVEEDKCSKYSSNFAECRRSGSLPSCGEDQLVITRSKDESFRLLKSLTCDFDTSAYAHAACVRENLFFWESHESQCGFKLGTNGVPGELYCNSSYSPRFCSDSEDSEFFDSEVSGCAVPLGSGLYYYLGDETDDSCPVYSDDNYHNYACYDIFSREILGSGELPDELCDNELCAACIEKKEGEDTTSEDYLDYVAYYPSSCRITAPVNPECRKEATLFDYLSPGKKTFYTFKESDEVESKKYGDDGILMDPNNETGLDGEIRIFIEFLDSFTGTGREAKKQSLPIECASATFVDSCDACIDECLTSLFHVSSLMSMSNWLERSSGTFLVGGTSLLVTTGVTTVERILACGNCIRNRIVTAFDGADIVACEDEILICTYRVN